MLRTFSCGSSVTKGQRLRFTLRHVFALSSSFISSLPDYFVLTTSTYFSTFSVLHVRSTEPVSIHKRTRSLEGVWPTGRLVSTHKNDERSSSTRKLVANTQSSIHAEGFPKCAKEIGKVSNSCDVLSGILQDQCIDVEIVMESSMKAALEPWEGFREEFGNPPEYEIRECRECVWYYSKKMIQEQSGEILIVECLRYSSPSWERWILANDQAIKWAKARVFVYADSVLCLGKTEQGSGAAVKWKGKLEDIEMYSPYQDAVGIDGEVIELEWKKSQIFQYCPFFKRSRKPWYRRTSNRRNRIIFVSMFNDILWKSDDRKCITNGENVKDYA